MKLKDFNESLENLGKSLLMEATDNSNIDVKQELQTRYTNLNKMKDQIVKNLSQVDVQNSNQLYYNEELLKWLTTLSRHLERIAKNQVKDVALGFREVDYYGNQIIKSLKKGALVNESLTESMNRDFRRNTKADFKD